MIKLIFVVLHDINSKNTINLLNFLNKYVNELNTKNYIIEILPVTKDIIDTDNFKNFRESNNIQSIPSVVINNNGKLYTISNPVEISTYLENIILNKQPSQNNVKLPERTEKQEEVYVSDEEDITTSYLEREIKDKSNDYEDMLSTGHSDNTELHKKIKIMNNKKNIKTNITNNTNNNTSNTSNNADDSSNNVENDYETKLFNKAMSKKNIKFNDADEDDALISNKFLNE